jgi:hypothetical protein
MTEEVMKLLAGPGWAAILLGFMVWQNSKRDSKLLHLLNDKLERLVEAMQAQTIRLEKLEKQIDKKGNRNED